MKSVFKLTLNTPTREGMTTWTQHTKLPLPANAGAPMKDLSMHLISKRPLVDFCTRHSDAAPSLKSWIKIVENSVFDGPAALQRSFPQVDCVDGLYVFNLGSAYRLIAAIHFRGQRLFVRHVLTHADYDRGKWKKK